MLEKKITSLKNIIFIKGSICIFLIICSIWIISSLKENYADATSKLEAIRPLIMETRIKLHEITDSNSNVAEGVVKYNEIYGKTEELRCKEYQDILKNIEGLRTKYNLPEPINTLISGTPSKQNTGHNKQSYISVYDLKIEFGTHDTSEAFEIYRDILTTLPQYSLVYLMDIKETATITPNNISSLRTNTKPSMIKCKLYVKVRDVVLTKV